MTTVAYILEEAFREGGLVSELQNATPTQMDQALARLGTLVDAAYGSEIGEPLNDWYVGYSNRDVYEPQHSRDWWSRPVANSRLLLNHDSAETIYFPAEPENGARMQVVDVNNALAAHNVTLLGNGRLIGNAASVVLNTNGTSTTWLYDADTAAWLAVSPITIDGDMPFPAEFDEYFISSMAARLNPRYGRSMTEAMLSSLQRTQERMRARYAQVQEVGVDSALLGLSDTPGRAYRTGPFSWMN